MQEDLKQPQPAFIGNAPETAVEMAVIPASEWREMVRLATVSAEKIAQLQKHVGRLMDGAGMEIPWKL